MTGDAHGRAGVGTGNRAAPLDEPTKGELHSAFVSGDTSIVISLRRSDFGGGYVGRLCHPRSPIFKSNVSSLPSTPPPLFFRRKRTTRWHRARSFRRIFDGNLSTIRCDVSTFRRASRVLSKAPSRVNIVSRFSHGNTRAGDRAFGEELIRRSRAAKSPIPWLPINDSGRTRVISRYLPISIWTSVTMLNESQAARREGGPWISTTICTPGVFYLGSIERRKSDDRDDSERNVRARFFAWRANLQIDSSYRWRAALRRRRRGYALIIDVADRSAGSRGLLSATK